MFPTQSLHRAVQQRPDAIYSVFGSRALSNTEVADRVSRLAGGLRALGVATGDRVALLGLNSDKYLQAMYAVPWADAVVVPVNIRWSVQEIAYSLVDAGAEVLFIDDTFLPMLPALREECPELGEVVYFGEAADAPAGTVSFDEFATRSAPVADAFRGGDALAGIFYTGGTTGFPKGVMLSHRNLIVAAYGSIASGSVRVGGQVLGRRTVVPPRRAVAVGRDQPVRRHPRHRRGLRSGRGDGADRETPDHQHAAGADDDPDARRPPRPRPARPVVSRAARLRRLPDLPGAARPGATRLPATKFVQGYGMTETAAIVSMLSDADHNDPTLARSAGRATPQATVQIVDENGEQVPTRTVGEIVVRGEHIMMGYWNKPAETADALRDGWLHTGDGGYLDERGYIFIADRIKDMIISGGENVYSTEVESAVASHPAVVQVAVIGIPDAEWGERVHAVVAVAPGATLAIDELREHCRSQIAGYKCPRSFDVVTEFPISGAGKILKRELRARYL